MLTDAIQDYDVLRRLTTGVSALTSTRAPPGADPAGLGISDRIANVLNPATRRGSQSVCFDDDRSNQVSITGSTGSKAMKGMKCLRVRVNAPVE